ncbi:hypothetical protein ONS96_009047 [Cadophora gregata f. sp. sojae]|nr:hypothetical protein ONS96_009047 [Cadophora gregata f. sp. sojae]
MIPQVAYHAQHPSKQFEHQGLGTPSFDPLQQLRSPDTFAPLPLRSSRNSGSSLAPPYRAYPIENDGVLNPSLVQGKAAPSHSLAGQYHDPAEHMLRRKTPNGTLAAGYDGTPVQWSSKAPALKHLVLPVSNGHSTTNNTCTPTALDNSRTRGRTDSLRGASQQTGQMQRSNVHEKGFRRSHRGTPWLQSHFPVDSSQNVWDHIRHQEASSIYPNSAVNVPTVLQPLYQPAPGPTASDDGGLYGPYWPDGRFVPYRPAAVRDQGGNSQQGPVPSLTPNYGFGQQYLISAEPLPPFRHLAFSEDPSLANRSGQASFSLQMPIPAVPYKPPMASQATDGNTVLYEMSDDCRTPTVQSPSKPSISRFREKTLGWAHSIYVDLLAYLHQTRKEAKKSRHNHGSETYSKNSIYPKPPRQPASHLASTHWSQPDRNGSAMKAPQHAAAAPGHCQPSFSASFMGWQGMSNMDAPRPARSFNQDVPHYMSPFQTSPQLPISPLSKAKEALEMLNTLCNESGWCWIDGMLLGGCLAYGLEEYHKALDWYSKIIALDPRHVEAISNLAATLLCLNRREEAEQYWLQSVKLRPSYFEAVEHLIGLLCGDHRGTEAVSIIDFVERSLRLPKPEEPSDHFSETSSNADRESCESTGTGTEIIALEYDIDSHKMFSSPRTRENDDLSMQAGFGSSGFSVPGSENGRILALVHAKGNMLYALGDINGASKAFEEAVLMSSGRSYHGIQDLIRRIVNVLSLDEIHPLRADFRSPPLQASSSPLLLPPDKALQTARLVFTRNGELPGLRHVPEGLARRAAISTTSNSLLSLAKIFQDAMSNNSSRQKIARMPTGVGDILALYYLSLSLQPSPSTANNVGILLASVQQPASHRPLHPRKSSSQPTIPGVVPGSGIALALAYYNYGLNLDSRHAHIYTNLGSLLKDIGQLAAAITMYEKAVACDSTFDIALANLANAVKDQGRTSDAIQYYRRAVASSPDFAEAVCGLANALNSVCDWAGRGGVILDSGRQDRWHVDETGMITDARTNGEGGGWMKRVVDIVAQQLKDGSLWGRGVLVDQALLPFLRQLEVADSGEQWPAEKRESMQITLSSWAGQRWEGARIVRMIERAIKRAMHRWYRDKHVLNRQLPPSHYPRPRVPGSLTVPTAPTVLPFHTFTCPLSAKDIRMISQRNALRISCSTLKAPWMQESVFSPPPPPSPYLNVGYVSSDFNNHPLAHLMQSVFGLHNPERAKAFCYATTSSDNSVHRQQIEREAPVFRDASAWSADRLVQRIIQDEIHILVNLNGYTRGARNEIFAARPAPIQMSFMGFAGTLGAEWCDYILADKTAVPPDTLRPWRRNIDLEDQLLDHQSHEEEDWVYSENIIFCRDTFFCCDHAQSEPRETQLSWGEEQLRRWKMRKELFPSLSDDAIILGNFNQLYKVRQPFGVVE